ncbi:MAG TPA: hypothetical protein VEJ86_06020 [Candidatus Binataceae bacterium]|nr:hypothetical protein [Candidatus Binataceae bacterium]
MASLAFAGCATTPPPPPKPSTASLPILITEYPPQPDEWNLFPDPTTGHVEVYHQGNYVGAVTGDEPASEDPPLPHLAPDDSQHGGDSAQ